MVKIFSANYIRENLFVRMTVGGHSRKYYLLSYAFAIQYDTQVPMTESQNFDNGYIIILGFIMWKHFLTIFHWLRDKLLYPIVLLAYAKNIYVLNTFLLILCSLSAV